MLLAIATVMTAVVLLLSCGPETPAPPETSAPPDSDGDGIIDARDNCPSIANPNQANLITVNNTIGDACDDPDGDGVYDISDNCPHTANPMQANNYGPDGDEGDACDDSDGDGPFDREDNCPIIANRNQTNIDGDRLGDVCDALITISNATVLAGIPKQNANGTYLITANLTIGATWMPLTNFRGHLDGNHHTIRGLTNPLLATINSSAIITRIGIIGGILARVNYGNISYAYTTGNATCTGANCHSGNLVGQNAGAVTFSYAIGNSRCTGSACNSGGLVGYNTGAIVIAYATGNSTCLGNACNSGGLVGYNSGQINTTYAIGDSVCAGATCLMGGLIGRANGTISASYRVQSAGTDGGDGDTNRTLLQLRCPLAANATCAGATTYTDWDNTTWDFGDNTTLPTIVDLPACPTFQPNCRW